MASVLEFTNAGLTGSGTLVLPLPSSGWQSCVAVIAHEGTLTPASGWTCLYTLDINGVTTPGGNLDEFGISFFVTHPGNSPSTNWGFTQLYPNFVVSAVATAYDEPISDWLLGESTLGNPTSPEVDAGWEALVLRAFFDAGTSTSVSYPAGHGDQHQFRQVSAGAAALVGVCHYIASSGYAPTAAWTLSDPGAAEGSTGLSLALQFSSLPDPVSPTITTTTLSTVRLGTAFNQTLAATGDTPITWSVQSGALPPGLSLNTSTGQITGTPNGFPVDTWTYDVTIRATNSEGYDDQHYGASPILFPDEASRGVLDETAGGTPYQVIQLNIYGDNALMYAPYGKALGTSSVAVLVAHGAEDDETFIDNLPWDTVEHCLDNGWVLISPNAGGNQFANDTALGCHLRAMDWIQDRWPISDFIWYGFSMGANAGVVNYLRGNHALGLYGEYPITGLVLIDLPWNMNWHWNNGSGWEQSLIYDAYGGYDPVYDAAAYDPSYYEQMKAFVSYSLDDTVAIAEVDSMAMYDYTITIAGVDLEMHESYGEHENPPHFAPTEVNAWLDALILGGGGHPNTFDKIYLGNTPATKAYLGETLVWADN